MVLGRNHDEDYPLAPDSCRHRHSPGSVPDCRHGPLGCDGCPGERRQPDDPAALRGVGCAICLSTKYCTDRDPDCDSDPDSDWDPNSEFYADSDHDFDCSLNFDCGLDADGDTD